MLNETTHLGQRWVKPEFHVYTAGRWLFNEHHQLAARRVNFNLDELIKIAQGLDSGVCTKVEKLPEGNYNKAFLLTMESGHQFVAKVPNPNAGLPFYTTASEVATMEFVSSTSPTLWSFIITLCRQGPSRVSQCPRFTPGTIQQITLSVLNILSWRNQMVLY
jgi:hypothetical protein